MSEQMNTILEMTSSPNDALALRKSPQLAKLAAYFRRYAPRQLTGTGPPVSPPVGVNPRVGSGQAATLATRRSGVEAPPSIVRRLAKRWNSDLRVPSDGGIDDACPAITATPQVWLVLFGTARDAWKLPLLSIGMPTISPAALMKHAVPRYNGEPAGTSVLRSIKSWPCRRNARKLVKVASNDAPTTWPASLMPMARLFASPGTVPRSCMPVSRVHRA